MTAKQAGFNSDKVLNMSDSEFEKLYTKVTKGIVNDFAETYKLNDNQTQKLKSALEIEADIKGGKKVSDSEALKTRKALEDAGIYDDVLDYISKNGLEYSDFDLGKRVVGYDDAKFKEKYKEKIGG